MAMTISVPAPASPSTPNTPPSTDGPQSPAVAPQTLALPSPVDGATPPPAGATAATGTAAANNNASATTQAKRKPSRRANTAERRATHNAVERQRRETLNGRFLVRFFHYFPSLALTFSLMAVSICLHYIFSRCTGLGGPSSKSVSDSSSFQIFHRQLLNRPHSRFPSSSSLGCS